MRSLVERLRFWRRPSPQAEGVASTGVEQEPLRPRVLLVVFDPPVPGRGGRRLTAVCGFADPRALVQGYVGDLAAASGGYVQYQVVETAVVDELPRKADGYCYTAEEFVRCWERGGGWHEPDGADYAALLGRFDVAGRVARGELDELWCFGPPYAGFWESTMVGQGAYWCNAPPVEGVACARRFVVMGFNYERGVGEMLENFGHRTESILTHVFGSWHARNPDSALSTQHSALVLGHAWDRFTAHEAVTPGEAGCGTVHFAPNSVRDYDWGNPTPVWSSCDDWLHYPALAGRRRLVDCREWGGGDIRAHHRWWLAHLPRAPGRDADGRLHNWWTYAVDVS